MPTTEVTGTVCGSPAVAVSTIDFCPITDDKGEVVEVITDTASQRDYCSVHAHYRIPDRLD